MRNSNPAARRLGFMAPVLLFVLFFVMSCGILACVFARSAQLSAQARQLEAAVQISRSAAEAFVACGSADEANLLVGTSFDETGAPTREGILHLTIRETALENMQSAVIEVADPSGNVIYSLTVDRAGGAAYGK